MLAGIMIRRARERRSDGDLSAITFEPSSVLMSGEDERKSFRGGGLQGSRREKRRKILWTEPAWRGTDHPDRRHCWASPAANSPTFVVGQRRREMAKIHRIGW